MKIQDMRFEKGRRIIAVSDMHAHPSYLSGLLNKIGFADNDFLVLLGDMIECGPDNLGALRMAMKLDARANAVYLSGNWEKFMYGLFMTGDPARLDHLRERSLRLQKGYGSSLLTDMCREAGVSLRPDTDMTLLMPRLRAMFAYELSYLGALPTALDTGDYFFVHGGIPTLDRSALERFPTHEALDNDAFAEQDHHFDRYVIVGHWPVANYYRDIPRFDPHIDREKRIASIDGGVGKKTEAQLNALILRAGAPDQIDFSAYDELPRVRALADQTASPNPMHIRWGDPIEFVSESDGVTRVKDRETGRMIDGFSSNFRRGQDGDILGAATDYLLPVRAGDTLSMALSCPLGLFARKDGVSGWYRGPWETIQ